MVIKKFTKIKDFGVFRDFVAPIALPEFKRYNIIYGWNGSGKTTLSKLFASLNSGGCGEFSTALYEIKDDAGATCSHGQIFSTPIRVFNQEYVDDNVSFTANKAKPILILGEENQEAIAQIERDEKEISIIRTKINEETRQKKEKSTRKDRLFTDIARTIGQNTRGAISRTYRRPEAEAAFAKLSEKHILQDEQLTLLVQEISQESMEKQQKMSFTNNQLTKNFERSQKLANETVEANVISRLVENTDIAEWVERGAVLHEKHKNDKCEFCGSKLSQERIKELANHFNDADKKLKEQIDIVLNDLRTDYAQIQQLQPVDKMNLYQELREEYETRSIAMTDARDKLLTEIEHFAKTLESKKAHTTAQLDLGDQPKLDDLLLRIAKINEQIDLHNKKTDEFDAHKLNVSKQIETHYLSTIYDDVEALKTDILAHDNKIKELTDGVEGAPDKPGLRKLTERVNMNKSKVSSSHKACSILNESLKNFLGHAEITFITNDDGSGYTLKRGNTVAKSLSEGERTAIAFVYFTVQLKDENFDVDNSIVVIDDPVSSLDANSQYQAFSFLKTATSSVEQLFVLTHNFDFLKLLLNWQKGNNGGREAQYFMINNRYSTSDGSRKAFLDKLDTDLQKYESEYHYLFNMIYNYQSDGTIANAYKMPNIARKVLDNFLMFRIPSSESTYKRLERLNFDTQKKAAIYKFVNDQSHITGSGFDPALVPETQKNIGYLLELMQSTFPDHYAILEESLSQ